MERIDSAKRIQRWKLSMKSLISSMSCCNVMVRSRRFSRWKDLDRDILAKIFSKLDVMDITMGASRVCISWFLASHDKTLWKTIDLTDLESAIFFDPMSHVPSLQIKNKEKGPYHQHHLRKFLTEITKFSSTVPTNLFFNFYSYIQEEDLLVAAERMPNIGKLVFPRWINMREDSFQFAFSQWKNLHTLILIEPFKLVEKCVVCQVIGENCRNLTNLKFYGYLLIDYSAREIVRYFPNLKRLSFRCSIIRNEDVITLITGLQNLTILNLSHCVYCGDPSYRIGPSDKLVQTVTQKLEKFITCSQDCEICIENYYWVNNNEFNMYTFLEKNWRKDEITELEF